MCLGQPEAELCPLVGDWLECHLLFFGAQPVTPEVYDPHERPGSVIRGRQLVDHVEMLTILDKSENALKPCM